MVCFSEPYFSLVTGFQEFWFWESPGDGVALTLITLDLRRENVSNFTFWEKLRRCSALRLAENVVKSRLVLITGSFRFWLISATVHPKTGDVISSSVEERLRSLDAAWKRYDDCHYKLMSVSHDTLSEKKEEQDKWEKRLENFCEAREEAIEVLKSRGVDFKVRHSQIKILG